MIFSLLESDHYALTSSMQLAFVPEAFPLVSKSVSWYWAGVLGSPVYYETSTKLPEPPNQVGKPIGKSLMAFHCVMAYVSFGRPLIN